MTSSYPDHNQMLMDLSSKHFTQIRHNILQNPSNRQTNKLSDILKQTSKRHWGIVSLIPKFKCIAKQTITAIWCMIIIRYLKDLQE